MSDEATGGASVGEVCIANIGPRGTRRRRRNGVISFIVAIACTAVLEIARAGVALHVLLVIPFGVSTLYYFQVRQKT